MAQSLNLTIDQGSDFLVNLTVTDDSGTAYNLTEWTANSSFKNIILQHIMTLPQKWLLRQQEI